MSETVIDIVIQGIGWLGTILFIISYVQLNREVWTLQTIKYHVYNVLGSLFLVINTVYDFSYAAAMANLFWGIIACYGLMKYRKKNKAEAAITT